MGSTSDRVILWTHAQYEGLAATVSLIYQVATDANFATIVSTGTATASESTGYTAKADATPRPAPEALPNK